MASIFRKNIPLFLLILLVTTSCSKDDSPESFNLSTNVVPEEGGSLSINSGTYTDGEEVIIAVDPSEGFRFKNWEGDLSGTDNPAKINMSGDRNITAVFEKKNYTISSEIIGKWYIRNSSGELLVPQNRGTKQQPHDACTLYSLQFTNDGRFRLITEQGQFTGLYNVTGEDSIDLGIGLLQGVNIADGSLRFNMALTAGCSSENIGLPLTYVPDDAFESYLIQIEKDDVLDDFVLTENILNITGLSIVNNTLSDMTGIEDFVNLHYLSLFTTPDMNKEYSLDVSQNKNLQLIEIGGYRINDIDLSQNPLLEDLKLYTTDVKEFDLKNNGLLKTLVLYNNGDHPEFPLDLDFTMNPALEEIDIENTRLGEVDITKNHDLKRVAILESVDDLKMNGSYNELIHFSVTGSSPYVRKINFADFPNLETLYLCYSNTLDLNSNSQLRIFSLEEFGGTRIDLSDNPLLEMVFIKRAPNLSCIQVSEEQEVKIDSEILYLSAREIGYSVECN
ncbi:hypothetical protein RM545_01430 [Zunongwangia sp. F260]|uniref:Bacterial repeat domain-containing protein n=1 Tax=Autumnicola lenta TaxID=3075593 RepID=A0ABU3CG61_9FLAO|nr:hypothetical protein [Zunongwangia sp. F260]MDT0645337.1 hypothetical protein [Zunongwangia sp. F260]